MGFDEASLLPKPGQFVKLSGRGLDSREIKNVLHSGFSTYPFHLTSPFFHKVRVVFFFMNSSTRDDVSKRIIHETPIAATIELCVTIN